MGDVERRPAIAVWPFQTGFSTDPEFRLQLTDLTRVYLTQTGRFDVVSQSEQQEILEIQSKSLQDCYSDECAVKAGQLLSADKLVFGNLMRFGSNCVLALRMVDVEKGKEERSVAEPGSCQQEQLPSLVSTAVYKLSSGEGTDVEALKKAMEPPEAPPEPERPSTPMKKGTKLMLVGGSMVLGAVALGIAGAQSKGGAAVSYGMGAVYLAAGGLGIGIWGITEDD